MSSTPKIRQRIAALGRRQQDQISRAQLMALGLTSDAVVYRAKTGTLFRVHLGVFSLVAPPLSPLQLASAAVLACSPDGVLAGRSALALWWPEEPWPDVPTVAGTRTRERPGIDVRRVRGLTRADVRVTHGIRVTSPARTLLDCAPALGPRRSGLLVAEGRRSGRLRAAALDDVLARFPCHPGRATLLTMRDDRSRSGLEQRFFAFCARYGLPVPQVNVRVCGREVDVWFADERLIVEIDGWNTHRDRINFEDDREHDADALAIDIATYRMTQRRLDHSADREARRLKTILANRGSEPERRSAL